MRGLQTNRGFLSTISHAIRWAELDRNYDHSKSVLENADNLDVSLSTLYRYCHERFIDTNPNRPMTYREKREAKRKAKAKDIERFKDIYDPDLSLRKNLSLLEDAGLKMSLGRLQDWIEKYLDVPATPATPAPLYTVPDFRDWNPKPENYGYTISDWDTPEAREEENRWQFPSFDWPKSQYCW
jgi:hypothetical protein